MIASSNSWALYLLLRDLFHFVHPWWARVLVAAGLAGIVLGGALIWQFYDDRKAKKRRAEREARIQTIGVKYGLSSDDLARVRAEIDARLAARSTPTRKPTEPGKIPIPEGFE